MDKGLEEGALGSETEVRFCTENEALGFLEAAGLEECTGNKGVSIGMDEDGIGGYLRENMESKARLACPMEEEEEEIE